MKVESIQLRDIYKKHTRLRHEEKRNQFIGRYDRTAQFISYACGKKILMNIKALDDEFEECFPNE